MTQSTLRNTFLAGVASLALACATTPAFAQHGGGGHGGGGFHGGSAGGGGFHGGYSGGSHGGYEGYSGGRGSFGGDRMSAESGRGFGGARGSSSGRGWGNSASAGTGRGGSSAAHATIADGQWHSFAGEHSAAVSGAGTRTVASASFEHAGFGFANPGFRSGFYGGLGFRGYPGWGWGCCGWGFGFGLGWGWGWGPAWAPFWYWPPYAYWDYPWWGYDNAPAAYIYPYPE